MGTSPEMILLICYTLQEQRVQSHHTLIKYSIPHRCTDCQMFSSSESIMRICRSSNSQSPIWHLSSIWCGWRIYLRMMSRCNDGTRLVVFKIKLLNGDVWDGIGPCYFDVGQEFICDRHREPEGFCIMLMRSIMGPIFPVARDDVQSGCGHCYM